MLYFLLLLQQNILEYGGEGSSLSRKPTTCTLDKNGVYVAHYCQKYLKHRVWLGSQRSNDHVHIFNCLVIGKAFLSSLVEKSLNICKSKLPAMYKLLVISPTESYLKRPQSFSVLCTVIVQYFFSCGEFGVQCRLTWSYWKFIGGLFTPILSTLLTSETLKL